MCSHSRWFWPLIISLSGAAVAVFYFGDVHSPLRALVALWFLGICPGMAFVRLLRLPGLLPEIVLAIALSIALDGIVTLIMVYTNIWSPDLGLIVLIGLSLIGVVLQLVISSPTLRSGGARLARR
jgi:hypothetical protein